jgi:hypothetical protein
MTGHGHASFSFSAGGSMILVSDQELSDACKCFRQRFREYLDRSHYLIPDESGLTEKERSSIVDRAVDFAVQYFTKDEKNAKG